MTMPDLGRTLVLLGLALLILGFIVLALGRFHLPIGRLPGDLSYRGKNFSFSFPIVSCLLLSALLSLLFWIANRVRR